MTAPLDAAPAPTAADLIDTLRRWVDQAVQRLAGQAVTTPLIRSDRLDALCEGSVWIKPEVLQRTGSFKFRGAYNRLAALTTEERRAGVVAFSSGNHAQGVALAAKLLGIPAAIVMPSDAPRIKRANTERLGAEVIAYDRASQSREALAVELSATRGAVLVPSYDDPYIIAGQGTCGAEMVDQAHQRGRVPDQALICAGGGGLTAGCALALTAAFPKIGVYTVEPEGHDDHARSFTAGARQTNPPGGSSLCDALLAPTPGDLTFAVNRQLCAGGLVVSEAEICAAMRFAFEELKLVVEPGGAVALAAVLAGRLPVAGRTTLVVLSGGNVDPALFARLLTS